MATTEEIHKYLTQLGPHFAEWEGERAARKKLVLEGGNVIHPLLVDGIAIFKKTAPIISQEHFLAAPGATLLAKTTIGRLVAFVEEGGKANRSSFSSNLVGCLSDASPDVRGIAALLCGVDTLDGTLIAPSLRRLLTHDQDGLTKFAATLSLYMMGKMEKEYGPIAAVGLVALKKLKPQVDEDEELEWGDAFYRFALLVGSR